jgi:transposase
MPETILIRRLLLPELHLTDTRFVPGSSRTHVYADKESAFEVCPRCATPSHSVYDHRSVVAKDAPVRDKLIVLHIRKRRFFCKTCQKAFTEPIAGIKKGARTTERYQRGVLWACENFSDLKAVRRAYRCSAGALYKALYKHLELRRRRHLSYPWPKVIGIDEHFFRRNKKLGIGEFVSVVVDFKGRRLMEVVQGKRGAELEAALAHIPGRENVHFVALDMCDSFKSFATSFFPNAKLVADKFHVLRLLNPAINRRRKAITGDRRSLKVRRWLLRNGKDLEPLHRGLLNHWLEDFPELREVYHLKEALHGFYRIRGPNRAAKALTAMTDRMASSLLPEVRTLRRTLMKWRTEILAYFATRITNGRTEGFNTKAKLVKRRAYGYRSFNNYRLRLLNACA